MTLREAYWPTFAVSLALVAGIFVVDWWVPMGLAITVLYGVPVLIAARLANPVATPLAAAIASVLTILGVFRSPIQSLTWVAVCNRSFTLLIIWVTALLCLRRQQGESELREVYQDIEQQVLQRTADLAEANKDLEALRAEAVSQLAALVKSSDDAIIGMSLTGTVQSWNAGAERVYGYLPHEIIGRSISVLCPPDRLDEVPAMLDRIARGEHVRTVETIQRRKRGKRIDVSLTVSPVNDGEGAVVAASAIARDVTQRKRIEAALRESEARFRMMADTAPVMVWMSAPDDGSTFFNKRWLEFTGRTLEEEAGQGWFDGVHAQDHLRCRETYRVAHEQRQPFTMEYRLRRADGTYRWMLDTGVPRFESDGTLSGYIGSCIDLTERKEMEDELRKTLKERESLLREVHHRVKNNLQVISSLLNLQMASIKDPQIVQLFRECQIRISAIALLHETLHRSNDLSHINMVEYMRTLTGHLFRSYGVDNGKIRLVLNVDDVELDVDTVLTCGLIIDELVSNCLKHAFLNGHPGQIAIDLCAHDDQTYTLRVGDDGIGIPKDGRLNNPDSFGLELVSLMAEKLDGIVDLQSGQGTEWQMRFRPLHYQERI